MISRAAIEAAKKAAIAKAAEIDQTSVDTLDEESYRHLEDVLQAGLSAALAAEGMALVDQRDVAEGLVKVPVSDLRAVLEIARRNESSVEIECLSAYLNDKHGHAAMLKAAGASDADK